MGSAVPGLRSCCSVAIAARKRPYPPRAGCKCRATHAADRRSHNRHSLQLRAIPAGALGRPATARPASIKRTVRRCEPIASCSRVLRLRPVSTHEFKRTGLLRAGFQYQDLVAIELLIDYYRDRTLYQWVMLEAEDRQFLSIEDVVARRPDGKYDLIQVKFAADPMAQASALNWTWLTSRSGRSTSLLTKWSSTTLHLKQHGDLESAVLKTDRIPDQPFAASLSGGFVHYDSLPQHVKCVVDEQIGSPEDARVFFDTFEFIHSQPQIDDLEERLWTRMSSDTDRGGWSLFRDQVRLWSTRNNRPAPDGRIRFHHLRQAFSVERPKPIPQNFSVPDTYSIPDEAFDVSFLEEITSSHGITVLWGPPGRGKSTYLSHCVAHIDSSRAVCVRHHYFLSLRDRSEGRFHYHAISRSLEHQLKSVVPGLDRQSHTGLREHLESASALLRARNVRLIVIVDGLDHVWRDQRDRHEMQALFDDLLPLPTGMRLVVGTQKIAHQHLPSKLLQYYPEDRWTELPAMTASSVLTWLESQDSAGRLHLDMSGFQTRGQLLRDLAEAFHMITHGLPLHLIYSFEALVGDGIAISTEDVQALPDCPTGDIREYYSSLWLSLSAMAQIVLHVLSGLRFGPPPFAMAECFGSTGDAIEALHSVRHLLHYRETEVAAFHPSLSAFVRDLDDHRTMFMRHAGRVLSWLESGAPRYWRWAWFWITKAQLGDSSDLVRGPSREWALDALVHGYPEEQLVTIIDHAERVAFDTLDLPRFLSLRLLKTRAVSGPEYQTSDWPLFLEAAYSVTRDSYVHTLLRDKLEQADTRVIPYIVRTSDQSVRLRLGDDAISHFNRQLDHFARGSPDVADEVDATLLSIASVLSSGSAASLRAVDAWVKRSHITDTLRSAYVRAALLVGHNSSVISAGEHWTSSEIDRDVLAALCLEGLSPGERPDLLAASHPAIRCLAILKGQEHVPVQDRADLSKIFIQRDSYDPTFSNTIRSSLYETYFSSLTAALCGGTALGWSKIPIGNQTCWLAGAVRALELAADQFVRRWVSSQGCPTLRDIFAAFDFALPDLEKHAMLSMFRGVSSALRDIAVDMCTIALGLDSTYLIDIADIESVVESPYWNDEGWIDVLLERRITLHTTASAQRLIERITTSLDSSVTEFPDRGVTYAKLALFAANYGLLSIGRSMLKYGMDCILGYGWHKDMFAFEVLESIDMLIRSGAQDARNWLLDLAGAYEEITVYTDGDETRTAREEYYEAIANHYPNRVPFLYAQLIRSEDWYYAERLAVAFGRTSAVDCRSGRLLVETYLSSAEFDGLIEHEEANRPILVAAIPTVERRTGRVSSASTGRPSREQDDGEPQPANHRSAPSDYPPGNLEAYLRDSSSPDRFGEKGERAAAWLQHWDRVGRGRVALNEFETAGTAIRHDSSFANAFLAAFAISLRTQGRTEAYAWLTRAFVATHGWARWFSDPSRALAAMREVATNYPLRWYEFIRSTSSPYYPSKIAENGIAIGLSTLVRYLIEVGQFEIAKSCGAVMVSTFKEELSRQPIQRPDWTQ